MAASRARPRDAQRGASLVDALVGLVVVAVGMVTTARLQSHLRLAADHARQRAEAVRLAQQDIEQLRGYFGLAAGASATGLPSFADIGSATAPVPDASGRNTRYDLVRTVDDDGVAPMKTASVSVGWSDRQGAAQHLRLDSLIARNSPLLGAALAIAPAGRPVAPLNGRHPAIPPEASDLGDGRSAFKPVSTGSVAWVQDNRSGRVTAACSGVPTIRPSRGIAPDDLHTCTPLAGLLVSGRIRFSLGATARADSADDAPLSTAIDGPVAGRTDCTVESVKVVAHPAGATTRSTTVAAAAAPTDIGVAEWRELGDRHLRYHCIVSAADAAASRWSGRTTLVADGWRIGSASGERRVCRYLAGASSGLASERNAAHPEAYLDVDQPLTEQNFLVVDGLQACPGETAAGSDLVTVQHQP